MAMVHCAKKDLGLEDETYRAVLHEVTGHDSCRDCTDGELARVVEHFRARGWTPKKEGKRSSSPAVRLVWVLWGELRNAGALRNPSRAALRAYCKRMVQVEDPEWMNPDQLNIIIEGLKSWKRRALS